jgi:heat shock protein HtpX
MGLQLRLYALLGLMLAVLYGIIVIVGNLLGFGSLLVYGILALVLVFFQFLIGPAIVGWSMKVKEVTEQQETALHRMVAELAHNAGIKKPRVCVSELNIPNAFAYGHFAGDARVCVTRGIMNLLTQDELRAVIGHELTHVKNNDVAFITLLSVLPMICYYLGFNLMWFGGSRDNDNNGGGLQIFGIVLMVLYFITNLMVLYGSRIREYYADRGSVKMGNQPGYLANALYKLSMASGKMSKSEKRQVDGAKAFFISDPTKSLYTVRQLQEIDSNADGKIDAYDLAQLNRKNVKIGFGGFLAELFGTHPNMIKRIKALSGYSTGLQ